MHDIDDTDPSPQAPLPCAAARARAGFTLLELLVALVLLDFGLLALVAASAAASRFQASARHDARSLELGSARIERILSSPCRGTAAATEMPAPEIGESWTDAPAPNGTRDVSDSLVLSTSRGPRFLVLHASGRC